VFHQLNQHAVNGRLESLLRDRKTAQLKRIGYREIREPRIARHWANR
jgi:hypothetical protein